MNTASIAGAIRGPIVRENGLPSWELIKVLQQWEQIMQFFKFGSADPTIAPGVIAKKGSLYLRTTGGATTSLYVKSGSANTAWTAK